jgi:hypothetical protein
LLPEELGVHVGVTICEKSPAEAALAIAAAECQEEATLQHAILAIANFVRLFGCSENLVFYVKKLPDGVKDLKTVKSKA